MLSIVELNNYIKIIIILNREIKLFIFKINIELHYKIIDSELSLLIHHSKKYFLKVDVLN